MATEHRARATRDEDFAAEQSALARNWRFLGLASEIASDDDWFRARLGNRDIFLQRCDGEVRAFENRCPHRGYPLRQDDHGNGPIVCGFHGWRFDGSGAACDIPAAETVFGCKTEDMDYRIAPIEVALCGDLIFARLGSGGETLQDYLGPAFSIMERLGKGPVIARQEKLVESNWRHLMHISLDDYHPVVVHPSTFGKSGHRTEDEVRYIRFQPHSSFFLSGTTDALDRLSRECSDGTPAPGRYQILQLFPNLMFVIIDARTIAGRPHHYVIIQDLDAVAPDRTRMTSRIIPLPPLPDASFWERAVHYFFRPIVKIGVKLGAKRIVHEDALVCEDLEAAGVPFPRKTTLCSHEQRIAWFEEDYAAATR